MTREDMYMLGYLFAMNRLMESVDKKGISGWCEYDSEYGWYIDDKVTAWMPLPEPYKVEGSCEAL